MAYTQPSSPLNIKEAAYEKSNRKMRKENPGMGKRLTKGTNSRRVSFACRFAGGLRRCHLLSSLQILKARRILANWRLLLPQRGNLFLRRL